MNSLNNPDFFNNAPHGHIPSKPYRKVREWRIINKSEVQSFINHIFK